MAENMFTVEFLWLPKTEELTEINSMLESRVSNIDWKPSGPILKMKTNISNHCGYPVYVTDCKPRIEFEKHGKKEDSRTKAENALFYAEFLYYVSCDIQLEKSFERDYKKFIELFCDCSHGKLHSELMLKWNSSLQVESTIDTSDTFLEVVKFSLGNFSSLNTFVEHFNSKTSIAKYDFKITQPKVKLLHDFKRIILYFVVGKNLSVKKRNSTTHCMHKLEIQYAALHSLVISKTDQLTVYIRMSQSPLLYSVFQEKDKDKNYVGYMDLDSRTPWFRAVDLFEGSPVHLRKEFSMNTVIKIDFVKADEYDFLFQLLTHCKGIQIFFAPMTIRESCAHLPSFPVTCFETSYALQCILTYSYEIMDQLIIRNEIDALTTFLEDKSEENIVAITEALYTIFEAIIKGNIIMFFYSLKVLYDRLNISPLVSKESSRQNNEVNKKPSHLLFIKRAIATPTHFRFLPPQPTLKSRALRDCNPNFSLRVSIKDVNLDTINFTLTRRFFHQIHSKKIEFYNDYYKNSLLKGIKIGKRIYKYVGSSTSQLKAHGMWFYAKDDKNMTAEDLRKKFGQLEKIKKVPKFMARMGQTFSQSMGNIKVPQEWTNVNCAEDDVKGGVKKYLTLDEDSSDSKNTSEKFLKEVDPNGDDAGSLVNGNEENTEPYVFSDGIGRISLELAEEVYKELKVEESRPSAMQIRYAGCKGMLVVDPRLVGKKILFRKSMKKFDSDHDSLEILKFSEKRSASLNQPFITILEQLGIPKEAFLKLQKAMIQNHIMSMFDEQAACQFLNRNSLLRLDFYKMFIAKIHFTEDPLFRSMIYSLFQKQIELLKNKSSIEIPVNKGRSLFGVLDETFTLEYGQVFIQYSDWHDNKPVVLTGTVVVTKMPCVHPGDVRKFEAVDIPDLHHIVDCIVFPAKGPRPHPDEMAGSDLDGDEYHAIWLESLIFSSDNYAPMNFSQKEETKDLDRPITLADELDHFGNYIFNDNVGVIATAHLVFADHHKGGIFSEPCIRLAKKYSISLDFGKSGKNISLGRDRVHMYPDFKQKLDEKITYLSTKALGHLFRNCKKLEMGLETERNEIDYTIDDDLRHKDWDKKYKKSAERMLKQYSSKVEMFLRVYGFENEGQLLAGALINPPKYYENKHDLLNLMALLEHEVQWIFRDLQHKFFSEFGGKPQDGKFSDVMHQKASAWYMVCYGKGNKSGSSYFGLPWAVADVLVDFKNKNTRDSSFGKPKTILEDIIDKSVSKYMPRELTYDTDSQIILENRFSMLDVAFKVLTKWVKSHQEYFSDFYFKTIEKHFNKVFGEVTSSLTMYVEATQIEKLKKSSNIKKAISCGYYIIQTILKLAELGSETTASKEVQELGLLSWITLIKLACTYNPQYLGIPNESGEYAESIFYKAQDNIIDTLQLPINDMKIADNCDFTRRLLQDRDGVKDYLKKITNLRDIEFRYIEDKQSFVKFTVKGTRYCIEKLKDIVVMDNFYTCVVNYTPI